MELDSIIPWGRSLHEYSQMFALSDADLEKEILGCADGPASFNAELSARGGHVVSADPIYRFDASEIDARISEACPVIVEQVRKNMESFIWEEIPDVNTLVHLRMGTMSQFLQDYRDAGSSDRYLDVSLPNLPFTDRRFDLALCSHYLFLYGAHIGRDHHVESMLELCRVAREVRVYPLVELGGQQQSPYVELVMKTMQSRGITVRLEAVPYRFQKGATHMLVANN